MKIDQNKDHTKYNQTSARTCNPGRHAAGIKNKNKSNNKIFDSDWIAGVDYDEEIFEDDEDNKEEENTDNE